MTREEKIQKAADEYTERGENLLEYSDNWQEYTDYEYVEKAFIAGAEWADKHLDINIVSLLAFAEAEKDTIERACEWLEEHLPDYWSQKIPNTDEFLEELKKAMK